MDDDHVPVTKKEYQAAEAEAEKLKKELKRLTNEIARARDLGDLSENAEYHAAREQKGLVDAKLKALKAKLATFKIVEKPQGAPGTIQFGCTVRLYDQKFEEELTCRIVGGSRSSDPDEISVTSPVGKALLNKKKGDLVEVETPRGTMKYKVLEVKG